MKKLTLSVLTFVLLTLSVFLFACSGIIDINVNFIVDDAVYATVGTNGSEAIKMPENPTKEGYTFDGWYWDNDVWEKPFTANSILEMPLSSDMSDMKVYAKWEQENSTPLPEGTDISTTLLTVDGDIASISLSNSTQIFSFINDITVAKDASFIVARDIGCEQIINSKIATLNEGDNSFYILVTNGNEQKLYTVTVRRRPMYTVTFNTAGGSSVPSQTIEEGGILTAPQETTRAGYTFNGWNTDLTAPITENKTVTAQWTAHTNITYKVEYYKENVDKNGYDLVETLNLTGTTDSSVTAEQKTFDHFTLNTSKSTLSGNINGNGSLVLKVYYTREIFTVSTNSSHGTVTNTGNYGYGKEVTLKASPNIGYTFVGWYSNNQSLSTSMQYTVTIDKNIEARFVVKPEMQSFNFTSTATNCTITAIKDKTVTSIVVPDYVTSISKGAFAGCTLLESITIPFVGDAKDGTSNTHFGYIFGATNHSNNSDCVPNSLKTVVITGGKCIQDYAFYKCTGITSITIPSSVTNIVSFAFLNCSGLTSITIPDSVTSMGNFVFQNCSGLTSVTIGNGITSIGDYVFSDCTGLRNITIPNNITSIGRSAFYNCTALINVTIENGVKNIGADAFGRCEKLTSVVIPDSVTNIGNSAFYGCVDLTSLTIGSGVKNIGEDAFGRCEKLTKINFNATNCTLATTYIFSYVGENGDGITLTIGDNVKIPIRLLSSNSNLKTIIISESVISIGDYAFYNCDELTSIKYRGTEAQWNEITKGTNWDQFSRNYTIEYNYTGQ